MDLDPKLIESIIMSATAGQFGSQLIAETFSGSFEKLDKAKHQLYTHLLSGGVAIIVYIITSPLFVMKAALVAFLSGVFAEAAIKLLKKKNVDKADELAEKVRLLEKKELQDKIEYLESELKNKSALLIQIQDQRKLESEEPLQTR